MAAKNTVKYKQNRVRPILGLVDKAIESCLRSLASPGCRGTMSDLIRLLRLSLQLNPGKPQRTEEPWID